MRTIPLLLAMTLAACATVPPRAPDDAGVEAVLAFDRTGDRGGAIRGLADPASGRVATLDDPVRIASISKIVVAIGVMQLIEQRRLSLDRDVSDDLGYPLRNPAYPDRAVTLRMLLSHTAGVRDHDDQYALPLDATVRQAMADPRSWDPAHAPGAGYFAYSNMNFPIVAAVVERATGQRFDQWMQTNVLTPMRLDACFNWASCSGGAISRAVVLTQSGKAVKDDLHGRRPACPVSPARDGSCDLNRWVAGANGAMFAPQGGLRISPRDLARVGRMLLGDGMIDGVRILAPASVAAIVAPAWRFDGHNGDTEQGFFCRYGLAAQTLATPGKGCADDPAADGIPRVGHAGEAYGLRSGLWIDRAAGTGIVYYRTGLSADPAPGHSAFRAAEERLYREAIMLLDRPAR